MAESPNKEHVLSTESPVHVNTTTARPGPSYPQNQPPFFPQSSGLQCYFCRSDKDPNCINKPTETAFRECTRDNYLDFSNNLLLDPPHRPIPVPRSGEQNREIWTCHRMYTADESFTWRMCSPRQDFELFGNGAKEKCSTCFFDKIRATCCYCTEPFCNDANSEATSWKNVTRGDYLNKLFVFLFVSLLYSL